MRTVIVKIAHFYCSFAYEGEGVKNQRNWCMTPKEKANDKTFT